MEGDYDEDLRQNVFFQELKKREDVMDRVIRERWIICIPRQGSFFKETLGQEDINSHILVPLGDSLSTGYNSLSSKEIILENKTISVKDSSGGEICSSHLLFEETFYDKGLCKYRVWCIEKPLLPGVGSENAKIRTASVTNLQEAATFLWTEVSEKKLLKELTILIESFECNNLDLDEKSIEEQANTVGILYTKCLNILLKDANLKNRCSNNEHFYKTLKLSVETYLLYAIRTILRRSVSAITAHTDAALNKILRNSSDLELTDLDICSDLFDRVHTAKLKLSQLDRFVTVLGKTECLKRTVRCISEGLSSMSSDDLLPILVYLVVKSGLSNWIGQVTFLKYFRFSTTSVYEADEVSFLITSLEAAIEHLRTANPAYVSFDVLNDEFDILANQENLSHDQEQERDSLNRLCLCIETGDLLEAKKLLSERYDDGSADAFPLCHPLCTCDKCEGSITQSDNSQCTLVHAKVEKGFAALHLAASYGRKGITSLLLSRGADPNITDNEGRTPLHHAAAKGHREVISLLLCVKADPTISDNQKDTPLHFATENGHTDCVEVLLKLPSELNAESDKVDPNLMNVRGDTPLHRASKWGYEDIVKLLLEYGASPTLSNKGGQTALTVAHSQRVAELLGGNVIRRSSPCSSTVNTTPRLSEYHKIKRKDSTTSEESIISNISDTEYNVDKLFAAITQGHTCLACFYLGLSNECKNTEMRTNDMCHPLCNCERCASNDDFPQMDRVSKVRAFAVNARNSAGETALHLASALGSSKLVRILLDAGANVNVITDLERRTPLHLACLCDNVDVVKLLLNCATCELNSKDRYGDTPLHLAVKSGNSRLVRLLVRYGANTKVKNFEGLTPIQQLHEEIKKDSVPPLSLVTISNILKRDSVENAA